MILWSNHQHIVQARIRESDYYLEGISMYKQRGDRYHDHPDGLMHERVGAKEKNRLVGVVSLMRFFKKKSTSFIINMIQSRHYRLISHPGPPYSKQEDLSAPNPTLTRIFRGWKYRTTRLKTSIPQTRGIESIQVKHVTSSEHFLGQETCLLR